MMQLFLILLISFNSLMFLILNHPLTMGFTLMIQTLLISLLTGTFTFMFWFSYSLFLIFMGGMLILFMYMTSLASNEMFKFHFNFKYLLISLLILSQIILLLIYFDIKSIIFNNNLEKNNEIMNLLFNQNFSNNTSLILNKMFNFPMNLITLILVNYLFLTLIATVKITNIYQGPLRSKTF